MTAQTADAVPLLTMLPKGKEPGRHYTSVPSLLRDCRASLLGVIEAPRCQACASPSLSGTSASWARLDSNATTAGWVAPSRRRSPTLPNGSWSVGPPGGRQRRGPVASLTDVADINPDLIRAKLDELTGRFRVRGWEGPFYTAPDETVAYYAAHGKASQRAWEVWVQLTEDPDSDDPDLPVEPTRASLALSDGDLTELDVPTLARMLTVRVAGRAAHEILESAKLDGDRVLDPHAGPGELHETASSIYEYLMKGASAN